MFIIHIPFCAVLPAAFMRPQIFPLRFPLFRTEFSLCLLSSVLVCIFLSDSDCASAPLDTPCHRLPVLPLFVSLPRSWCHRLLRWTVPGRFTGGDRLCLSPPVNLPYSFGTAAAAADMFHQAKTKQQQSAGKHHVENVLTFPSTAIFPRTSGPLLLRQRLASIVKIPTCKDMHIHYVQKHTNTYIQSAKFICSWPCADCFGACALSYTIPMQGENAA